MAFKLYSIESRKGGVGKTTIAMNLAKQLLKSGPVLLLDCDITGTSISDPATNSVYWKEDANVLCYDDGTPYNLLGYFLDKYIKGNGVMEDFTKEGMLIEKKINVIGSQLYAPTSRSIVDTRVLMDEIHSYWLMEFVSQLISAFEKKYSEKFVHVIIDNSPGYVGFCQALHNAMFRLGPSQAKYLMVSSIDEQDIKSCIYACTEISSIIKDRIKVAQYYKAQIENKPADVEIEHLIMTDSELKRFFFSLTEDKQLLQNYTDRAYSEKDYLAIILNKVPKSLEEDNFDYAFENVLTPKEYELFKEITSTKGVTPQTIINYDEAISYQYYWKYLRSVNEDAGKDPYWTRRFRTLLSQNNENERQTDRIAAIDKQDGIYQALMSSLSKHGYSRVAKSLPVSWNPSFAYEQLSDMIIRIARRGLVYRKNVIPQELSRHLIQWSQADLDGLKHGYTELFASDDFNQLYHHTLYLAEEENEDGNQRAVIFTVMFLHVTLMQIVQGANQRQDLRETLLRIVREDSRTYKWSEFISTGMLADMQIDYNYDAIQHGFELYYGRFFRCFCKTLLRMMDMHKDYTFLISALKLYVPTASPLMLNRELIAYLTDVMVTKTMDYDTDKLAKLRDESFVMRKVLDVLRDTVLKNWR